MEKVLTTKQMVTLAFLLPFLTKLLALPSILTSFSGKYAYFVVLLIVFVEFTLAYFVFKIINKSGSKSFFALLKNSLGEFLAKIAIALYTIYFFVKALLLILETNNFFNYSFYENFSPYLFVFSLFALLFYVVHLKFKTFARSIEVFKIPFALSIVIAVVASFLSANPINSLPILESDFVGQMFNGLNIVFWFGDFLIFFLFIGRVEVNKDFSKKVLTSFFASGVLIVLFVFNFYNMFSVVAPEKTLALADILSMVSHSALNKVDWLIVFIWSIALIYGVCFMVFLMSTFIKQVFNQRYTKAVINLGLSLLIIAVVIINFNMDSLISFLTSEFVYFALFLQYVLPVFLIIFTAKFLRV